MNVEIPEAYGGLGGSLPRPLPDPGGDRRTAAPASTRRWPRNMLGAMPLLIAGTEEQKKKYLGAADRASRSFAAYCCSRARRRLATSPACGPASRKARRRLRAQRPEALDHQRRRRQLLHRVRARSTRRCGTRASPASSSTRDTPGRQGRQARRTRWASARSQHHRRHLRGRARSRRSALVGERGRRLQDRDEDVRPLAARGSPPAPPGIIRRALDESRAVRARAQDLRRADRAAPGGAVHARRDGDRLRDDAPALPQGGVDGRPGQARQHRLDATPRPTAPTRRCASPPTRCRSSAATATPRSTRSRS